MKTSPAWFESLSDSVYALGAAAREAQHASRTAEVARDSYDLNRLRPVDGRVQVDDRPDTMPFLPHDQALFAIGDIFSEQADRLRSLYVHAAIGYAYGSIWAILRVLDGQHPDAVQLGRTSEGFYLIPGGLHRDPSTMTGLKHWNHYPQFIAAHARMLLSESAGMHADCLSDQPHLTDREASELHQALDSAASLPEATYAFGVLAESALHFALLEPRAQHARTHTSH
ncbi:hypothetical protein [Streptomyces sp. NBC_00212]|uniref:hypothetical protein n=1 Tax=Streptomyces sp. NBC_00212 TaxID=2975684 RepID=UPI00324DE64E